MATHLPFTALFGSLCLHTYVQAILRPSHQFLFKPLWTFGKWWSIAWLVYYALTDANRRLVIRSREKMLRQELRRIHGTSAFSDDHQSNGHQEKAHANGHLERNGHAKQDVSDAEKRAWERRYASLWFLGRYWNPFVEWREQGAWETFMGLGLSIVTLRFLQVKGGVPAARPIPDLPVEQPEWSELSSDGDHNAQGGVKDGMRYLWIGQSTSYVQMDGLCILTDPQFSDKTMPGWKIAPRRIRELPCSIQDLKRVDIVLVSHNHYDHLDILSIHTIGNSATWFVPLGMGGFMRQHGIRKDKLVELDWWGERTFQLRSEDGKSRKFSIKSTPNMHWTARSPLDTNTSLSCCWYIRSDSVQTSRTSKGLPKNRSFFHVGDTGYSATLFPAIGRVIDDEIDVAAIPIGSYQPRWSMHLQHTDPDGSVRIAQCLNVRKSYAAHWGTWIMSEEKYDQPPIDLALARTRLGMAEEDFEVVPAGRVITIS